jgi:hypothetical protein
MKLVNLLPPTETEVRDSPKNTNVMVTLCGGMVVCQAEQRHKGKEINGQNLNVSFPVVLQSARKRTGKASLIF